MMRTLRSCFVGAVLIAAPVSAQPTAPRATLTEVMRISAREADLNDLFGFFLVTPSNHVVIADLYEFQIVFFDERGKRIASPGRKGGGPGEYQSVNGVHGQRMNVIGGLVGDTVWVYDWGTRRVTFYSSNGKLVRSSLFPAAIPMPGRDEAPAATTTERMIAFSPTAIYGDGSILGDARIGTTGADGRQFKLSRTDVVRITPDGRSHKTLAIKPTHATIDIAGPDGRPQAFNVPNAPIPFESYAADGNRFLIATPRQTPKGPVLEIVVISSTGDTLVNRKLPYTGIPVSTADAEKSIENLIASLTTPIAGRQPPVNTAYLNRIRTKLLAATLRTKAPFAGVRLADDNSIWLLIKKPSVDFYWLVLDENGNPWGEVPNTQYPYPKTKAAMWSMPHDSEGLSSIVKYSIIPGK